ncbi:MAG: hypothetical protein MZW92_52105 [Comamonadaceae bacterium]|nr:hypothetical protein [Comamonadaceae bacterium]
MRRGALLAGTVRRAAARAQGRDAADHAGHRRWACALGVAVNAGQPRGAGGVRPGHARRSRGRRTSRCAVRARGFDESLLPAARAPAGGRGGQSGARVRRQSCRGSDEPLQGGRHRPVPRRAACSRRWWPGSRRRTASACGLLEADDRLPQPAAAALAGGAAGRRRSMLQSGLTRGAAAGRRAADRASDRGSAWP